MAAGAAVVGSVVLAQPAAAELGARYQVGALSYVCSGNESKASCVGSLPGDGLVSWTVTRTGVNAWSGTGSADGEALSWTARGVQEGHPGGSSYDTPHLRVSGTVAAASGGFTFTHGKLVSGGHILGETSRWDWDRTQCPGGDLAPRLGSDCYTSVEYAPVELVVMAPVWPGTVLAS